MSINKFKSTKFSDIPRVRFILILLFIVFILSISVPSLARYRNYINLEAMLNEVQTWDGSVASSYNSGSGTESDPYIIMNASQLAYFSQQLNNGEDYTGIYFKLGNHIVLNDGLFGYSDGNITYTVDNTTLYINKFTGDLYDNANFTGSVISSVNLFENIDKFTGNFDGDYFTIYGLYITNEEDEVAFIKELTGNFSNVYFDNAMIYGGSSSAVLANNAIGAEISNVSTNGVVVGTGDTYSNSVIVSEPDVSFSASGWFSNASSTLNLNVPSGYTFSSVVLNGNLSVSNSRTNTVAGTSVSSGDFSVTLSNTATSVEFRTQSMFGTASPSYTNLTVQYTYNYPISSGLVAKASDTTLNNVTNEVMVYGENVSGLVGIASNIKLSNAYNNGQLNGTNAYGVIGQVVNNTSSTISQVYNNGELNGNTYFVGDVIGNNSLVVNNSFNAQAVTSTFKNVNGSVEVNNFYDVSSLATSSGTITNTINVVNREDINKTLLIDTLGFEEYVDDENLTNNPNSIWVYEKEDYPILYIDRMNNPVASLNVGIYSWNDLGYELSTREFLNTSAFNVSILNGTVNVTNTYYYIFEGNEALSREEIENISEWNNYSDIVSLNKEGYYVIYIKMVDEEGNDYYINSDVLFFELYGPNIDLTLNDNVWNDYKEELGTVYVDEPVSLMADVSDNYSDVVGSKYYVANKLLSDEELNEVEWIDLENNITVDTKGVNVVYVKSEDSKGHINTINSDYIVYGGYVETLYVGTDSSSMVESANVTNESSVVYKFVFDEYIPYVEGYNSNIILSDVLPENTMVTFIDHNLGEVYGYRFKANDNTIIPLSSLSKIGSLNTVNVSDSVYLSTDTKNVSLIFDFSNVTVENDFNFNACLDLRDSNGKVIMSTLKDSIKNVNVYTGLDRSISLVKKNDVTNIVYNSNSSSVIEFEYSFEDLVKNNVLVEDTKYEGMKSGIAVSLVDSNGTIVAKEYLKNLEFLVNGKNYFAGSDGIVRINLGDNLDTISNSLTVVTYENELDVENGNYSLKIVPYVSYDGEYYSSAFDSSIIIDVVAEYERLGNYEFDVSMEDSSRILVKEAGSASLSFSILSDSEFVDPSVRVSFYKKKDFSPYNQEYLLADLADYIDVELSSAGNMSYYIDDDNLEINLDMSELEKTGYEFRFELYEGNKRVDVIKKKILIK